MLRLDPAVLALQKALGRLQCVPVFQQCPVADPWRVHPWLVTRGATLSCLVLLREKRVCICWVTSCLLPMVFQSWLGFSRSVFHMLQAEGALAGMGDRHRQWLCSYGMQVAGTQSGLLCSGVRSCWAA